jgi:subtilase family serine protease
MMRPRLRSLRLLCAMVVVPAVLAAACSGQPSAPRARSGSGAGEHPAASAAPEGFARLVGPADPAARVEFSAVLQMAHEDALQRFLDGVNDPASPSYRHFLDAAAFGRRFGLPLADIARARRELEDGGLRVTASYPQRTSLDLRGSVAALGDVFGVRMGEFVTKDGRRFHAPLSDPVIPQDLRGVISGVAGLNTGPLPASLDVPAGGLKPTDTAKAYDIQALHDQGIQGQGQTIAIVSFASFRQSDVDEFDRLAGVSSSPVQHIKVNGGSPETTTANSGEVNLDIDVVRGIAPKARILNYEVPLSSIKSFTSGVSAVINRIVQDAPSTGVQIASMSWGLCDVPQLADGTPWLSAGDRAAASRAYQAAVAAGVTVFVASGDAGAFGCQRFDLSDHRATATWPGDDPNVVSVGGTLLSVRQDGSYLEETGWEDQLEASGGGGGLNPQDPRPAYQQAPGIDKPESNGNRQFPDVAAAADPDSGFFTVSPDPQSGAATPGVVGGTSAATPFWASSMVLIQQFAQQQGVKRLGFVNPVLYRLASSSDATKVFHDVVLGGNRLHNAAPGWDFSTGLGSPDVFELAQAMVTELKKNPAA